MTTSKQKKADEKPPVTIQVSRGLCSAMREDVLTALDYGIKILAFDCRGYGHHKIKCPDWTPFPDSDIWVRKHVARITVSAAQAKYAERLLWQSNKVELDTPKLNANLEWSAPPDCKVGEHGTVGRGTSFKKWKDNLDPEWWKRRKRKPTRVRQTRRTRQARRDEGDSVLDILKGWLR
jgi:hypothetical protein